MTQAPKGMRIREKETARHGAATAGAIFLECFAGCGELSKAVRRVGVQTDTPQDGLTGGTDFADNRQVLELWEHWRRLRAAGLRLFFHFAPPCSTFSRARDRSWKTKLRSFSAPGGLDTLEEKTKEANDIAKNTAHSINYLVTQLGASGSLEQPASSYMLPYLDQGGWLPPHGQVLLHQCRFGRPYRKPTVFLTFGDLDLSALAKTCSSATPCGRPFHTTLGFGESSTSLAAAYPTGLCAAYAGALFNQLTFDDDQDNDALDRLEITANGVVRRHVDRGAVEPSQRVVRARADAASRAGRNPSYGQQAR